MCAEYVHMIGKNNVGQWCVKCIGEDHNLYNGQCVAKTDLTEASVCNTLLPTGHCKNCYEYEGPLSETKVWTCGKCSSDDGVYEDT